MPVAVDDAPRSCKDWISVQPERFNLRPGDGQRLICRLRTPAKMAGGYYGAISCHGVPAARSEQEATAENGVSAAVRFSYRIMAVVLVTVPGSDLRAIIEAGKPMIAQSEAVEAIRFSCRFGTWATSTPG